MFELGSMRHFSCGAVFPLCQFLHVVSSKQDLNSIENLAVEFISPWFRFLNTQCSSCPRWRAHSGDTTSQELHGKVEYKDLQSNGAKITLQFHCLHAMKSLSLTIVLLFCFSISSSTSVPATVDSALFEDPFYHPLQDLETIQTSSIEGLLKARACPSGTGLCKSGGCCPIHGECCNNGNASSCNLVIILGSLNLSVYQGVVVETENFA